MAHPAAEDEIEAWDGVGGERRLVLEEGADLGGEFGGDDFVGVDVEEPGVGAVVEGAVDLSAVAAPGLVEDGGAEATGDVEGGVGGTGVDEDDLVGPGDGFEGARNVLGFVHGNDGDGEPGHGFKPTLCVGG